MLWLSGLQKHDNGSARDEDVRGACDAGDCRMISKCANELPEKAMKKDGTGHRWWIVPDRFCSMRCIVDARYSLEALYWNRKG